MPSPIKMKLRKTCPAFWSGPDINPLAASRYGKIIGGLLKNTGYFLVGIGGLFDHRQRDGLSGQEGLSGDVGWNIHSWTPYLPLNFTLTSLSVKS